MDLKVLGFMVIIQTICLIAIEPVQAETPLVSMEQLVVLNKKFLASHNKYRKFHSAGELKLNLDLVEMATNFAEECLSADRFITNRLKYKGLTLGMNLLTFKGFSDFRSIFFLHFLS